MAELKGKYAPYFDLIVDSSRNKKTLKCKLCSGGSTLAYHGNTSVMKSHLEAKHAAEYRKMLGETSGSGQLKASAFFQPTFKQFVGQSGMPLTKAPTPRSHTHNRQKELCAQVMPENAEQDKMEEDNIPRKVKRESEAHSEAAMKYLLGDVYEISDEEDNDVETEVARYIAEPQRRDDPLKWWKMNGHHFPYLQKLARIFLCRPSTNVPSERLFSAAGLTVTKGRARLDPDTVDWLLFLHCYYKEKGSGFKQEVIDEEHLKMKQKSSKERQDGGEPSLPTLKMEIYFKMEHTLMYIFIMHDTLG